MRAMDEKIVNVVTEVQISYEKGNAASLREAMRCALDVYVDIRGAGVGIGYYGAKSIKSYFLEK